MHILLAVTILSSLVGPTYSKSPYLQSPSCYFDNFKPDYPESAPSGQSLEISTTVTVVCSGGSDPINRIRVNLIDSHTQQMLSQKSYDYVPKPSVTVTLVNNVTAPLETGSWGLQVQAYVIGQPSDRVLASTQQLINVLIVQYTPTSTTPKITSTVNIVLTTASTSIEIKTRDNSAYYVGGFITLIAIIAAIMIIRRKRSGKDKTRVY